MEIVSNVHKAQDFRKTNAVVIMLIVNIIKLRQMMDNVQIAHLTQDHVQMKQVKKFVRQTSAPRGKK